MLLAGCVCGIMRTVALTYDDMHAPVDRSQEQKSESQELSAQCAVCRQAFASQRLLQAHLTSLRPVDDDLVARITCSLCNKVFGDQRALAQHALHAHSSAAV